MDRTYIEEIEAGKHDEYLAQFQENLKTWGRPLVERATPRWIEFPLRWQEPDVKPSWCSDEDWNKAMAAMAAWRSEPFLSWTSWDMPGELPGR